ncbi:hypothetical protein OG462_14625 [Streptomyces sp. NBC_01077]|uniref:hypothetical protein n=1 Tax=Streptomyces sp. NBC_01077 TaxID=2903746 RepID=UPI0038647320|nr:hypothetical protein OG462_14625 [Streptomyces sp. NBC_01077]
MPTHDQGSALSRRGFLMGGAACAGVLAVPPVAHAQPQRQRLATATASYTLTVTNNSTQFQDICLYQKPVDPGVPNTMSLAWLIAPAWPTKRVTFTWSLDYSFSWAMTGELMPGIHFSAWEQAAADPESQLQNRIGFDFDNGNYGFVPAGGGAQLGTLEIDVSADVPAQTASVAIGMPAPVFAVQAEPGAVLPFTPHPEYWVTAGTFSSGQVLDIEEITNEAPVPFDGTFAMQAVLGPTNLWSVSPG